MTVVDVKDGQAVPADVLRSKLTGHEARWSEESGGWIVSWLPGQVLTLGDAKLALSTSDRSWRARQEPTLTEKDATHLGYNRAALGLDMPLEEMIEAAAGSGPIDTLRCSVTGHEARWSEEAGGWAVSWLPGRTVTRAQARAALELSELACVAEQVRGDAVSERKVGEHQATLGLDLSLEELAQQAGNRGPAALGHTATMRMPRALAPPPVYERMRRVDATVPAAVAPSTPVASVASMATGESGAGGDGGRRLTTEASPEQLADAMREAATEMQMMLNRALDARDTLVARGWGGLDEVVAACEALAKAWEVLITVGEKVGVGGAAIRAAYLAAPMVGEKSTVVEGGASGGWCPAPTLLPSDGAARSTPAPSAESSERAAVPPTATAVPVPRATDDDGGVAWRATERPLRRCTAPAEGWQAANLCTTCETEEQADACPRKHEEDFIDAEWRLWTTDLDGYPDWESNQAAYSDDGCEEASSVTGVLDTMYSFPGLWVAQELATGQLWTVEELGASYPELRAEYQARKRGALDDALA